MSLLNDSLVRLIVADADLLNRLKTDPLPVKLRSGEAQRSFFRDLYFDTHDRVLESKRVTCRLRMPPQGERILTVRIRTGVEDDSSNTGGNVFSAVVPVVDEEELFEHPTEPTQVLRAIIDPQRLSPRVELEMDRTVRAGRGRFRMKPQFEFRYDTVTVRAGELEGVFQDLTIRRVAPGGPDLKALTAAFDDVYGIQPGLGGRLDRARSVLDRLEVESLEHAVQAAREVAVIPFDFGRVGMHLDNGVLKVLTGSGGGEEAARAVLKTWFLSSQAQLRLLGTSPGTGNRPAMEVWIARRIPTGRDGQPELEWLFLDDMISLVGSPSVRDSRTLAALHVAARSELVRERPVWAQRGKIPEGISMDLSDEMPTQGRTSGALRDPQLAASALDVSRPDPEQFINRDLSQLAFNLRVLELAEDRRVPTLERLKYLSIFNATMDEVFMVRVGVLKRATAGGGSRRSIDGLTAGERLEAVAIRSRRLIERAYGCLSDQLLPELAEHGIKILRYSDMTDEQIKFLRGHFEEQVFPVLTPLAASPSHPFPHIPNFTIAIASMVRDPGTGTEHFAAVPVPPSIPRFIRLPETHHFVPIEAVMCANIEMMFHGLEVISSHWLRVTRSGEVRVDEWSSQDLMQAIEEEIEKRPFGPVVRLEVDAAMPKAMVELLVQEFCYEEPCDVSMFGESDVYQYDWLPDLGGLGEIAKVDKPELHFGKFAPAEPDDPDRLLVDLISEGDIIKNFPFDSFEMSAERFFVEAAEDPDVLAIKVTLYRTNQNSQIVRALERAVATGKQVVALVELKARFEEERNIEWAKSLERAGIHVVYGLLGLKTHGKIGLVVRREGDAMRRYVYVGTGNLNSETAKHYTDFGFFTADPEIGADINDLFNAVSGYAPREKYRRLLVAPHTMLPRFLELIERESEHSKAGRGGRIRAKMNGLGDPELIAALYRASQAGVHIDLIVRGICSLRPGVRGLSDRIRVICVLGRFLEHPRIFHFGNDDDDEYYIGSADWRTRNLRRRVEVVVPITDKRCQSVLDKVLDMQLYDPLAWELTADGSYVRRNMQGVGSQEQLIARALGDT